MERVILFSMDVLYRIWCSQQKRQQTPKLVGIQTQYAQWRTNTRQSIRQPWQMAWNMYVPYHHCHYCLQSVIPDPCQTPLCKSWVPKLFHHDMDSQVLSIQILVGFRGDHHNCCSFPTPFVYIQQPVLNLKSSCLLRITMIDHVRCLLAIGGM